MVSGRNIATTQLHPVTHEAGAQRMGLTYLAFAVGDDAEADRITRQLAESGVPGLGQPHWTGDDHYESVVLDPEGNRIEICARRDGKSC